LSRGHPSLAGSFRQHPEAGLDLRLGLHPGDTVLLTHREETAAAPAGQGGTGKTQIAVAFSQVRWGAGAVDVLVWVPTTSRAGPDPLKAGNRGPWRIRIAARPSIRRVYK